jgi:hypothetical protein
MKNRKTTTYLIAMALASTALLLAPVALFAHCDGLDGPVVTAARKAIAAGNVNLVLPWVQKADEPEIRAAFEKTLAVRTLNLQAKELADTYFFETLVRVHRAGEGAPYTGLKPAGRDLGPAIPAGDKAIETRSAEALLKLLTDTMRAGLHARFHETVEKSGHFNDSVDAGREYVKSYVEYIHYVEGIYEAAKGPAGGHEHDAGATEAHRDVHE